MDTRRRLSKCHSARTYFSLDSRHKKRRPWTSLDDEMVGRGNLNLAFILLIIMINKRFVFYLGYQLECLSAVEVCCSRFLLECCL
jgi:hypothetical protein